MANRAKKESNGERVTPQSSPAQVEASIDEAFEAQMDDDSDQNIFANESWSEF